MPKTDFTSIEICAGAGGQAIGLEQAGFEHLALVEIEPIACDTLLLNRPTWTVINKDVKDFSSKEYSGVDLLAGGVPCPPFSIAGKQLGHLDERDLFPEALRLIKECNPKTTPYCITEALIQAVKGNLDEGLIFVGSNACKVDKIITVKELMSELVKVAEHNI